MARAAGRFNYSILFITALTRRFTYKSESIAKCGFIDVPPTAFLFDVLLSFVPARLCSDITRASVLRIRCTSDLANPDARKGTPTSRR